MRFPWILTLTLAVGCGDDKNNSTSSGSEGSSSTDATSSTSTTDPTTTDPSGTMGGSQTMGETTGATTTSTTTDALTSSTGSTGGSSGGGSSGGSSGGGGDPDIPAGCMGVCDKAVTTCMIEGGGTVEDCTLGCVSEFGGSMGACAEATVAFLACLEGLECPALEDALANDNLAPCMAEAVALGMACG